MDKDVAHILLSHKKKEWDFDVCSNVDGLAEHYAKWNKPDRAKQILYDMSNL